MNKAFLHVDSIAYGGEAVGRLASGKVCFVPGGLPGEELEVEIIQDKKSFARAKIIKILMTKLSAVDATPTALPSHKSLSSFSLYLFLMKIINHTVENARPVIRVIVLKR